jgi:hypothetical protein
MCISRRSRWQLRTSISAFAPPVPCASEGKLEPVQLGEFAGLISRLGEAIDKGKPGYGLPLSEHFLVETTAAALETWLAFCLPVGSSISPGAKTVAVFGTVRLLQKWLLECTGFAAGLGLAVPLWRRALGRFWLRRAGL